LSDRRAPFSNTGIKNGSGAVRILGPVGNHPVVGNTEQWRYVVVGQNTDIVPDGCLRKCNILLPFSDTSVVCLLYNRGGGVYEPFDLWRSRTWTVPVFDLWEECATVSYFRDPFGFISVLSPVISIRQREQRVIYDYSDFGVIVFDPQLCVLPVRAT